MQKLTRETLYSLEEYANVRKEFRLKVLTHKKARQVSLGANATLYFEDALTMQYQIQEMLRIEKIFEAEGIEDELSAYNPLIPDGTNWKATFMIEYDDPAERKGALERLVGIEDRVWVQVAGFEKVFAIADEDMERETTDKTSAVHFLRFELTDGMIAAVRDGANLAMGIDHANYNIAVDSVEESVRQSLVDDLH